MKKKVAIVFLFLFAILFVSDCHALELGTVSDAFTLNVRKGPGVNYAKLAVLKNNDSFVIMDKQVIASRSGCVSGWYQIKYNADIGYVCSSYVSMNDDDYVVVTNKSTNIYSDISRKKVVAIAKYNQPFVLATSKTYKYKNKNYFKVYYKNKKRYVEQKSVLRTQYNYIVANQKGVNIRKSPSNKSALISYSNYGKILSLVSLRRYNGSGCRQGFYKIKMNGKFSYVCSNYLSSSDIITKVNKNSFVYTGVNAQNKITSLKKNQMVVLNSVKKYEGYNCQDGYYRIVINGKNGYVCSSDTMLENDYANKIPVLTFHRVVYDDLKQNKFKNDEWTHSYDVFSNQIKYLYDHNYKTISLQEFYCWYKGNCNFPKKTVVITFDDGNLDDYYLIMPLLKKYNFKAVTFVVGSRINEKQLNPYNQFERSFLSLDIINKSRQEYPNHDFQSHSYNFHYYDLNKRQHVKNMTRDEIREDFELNKKYNFKFIAYPYGAYTKDLKVIAKEKGMLLGFRFSPADYATRKSDPYAIPRIKINGFSTVDTMKKYLLY